MLFLFVLLSAPFHLTVDDDISETLLAYAHNKQIPPVIQSQTLVALSHYPELKDTDIRFEFSANLKGPIMAARPVVGTLFGKRNKRAYRIVINPMFKLKHLEEPIQEIPDSVMIGWIGHELGHIMDYETKNTWGMMGFGVSYWLSKRYIRKAERVADTYAVNHHMGEYIVATKKFILGHSDLPQPYKDRIARLYLSPDDIMTLVVELEDETDAERSEILEDEERVRKEIEGEEA